MVDIPPVSLTQTPVSSVGGGDVVTTGDFFSRPQPDDFGSNPADLVRGSVSLGGNPLTIALIGSIGLLGLYMVMR